MKSPRFSYPFVLGLVAALAVGCAGNADGAGPDEPGTGSGSGSGPGSDDTGGASGEGSGSAHPDAGKPGSGSGAGTESGAEDAGGAAADAASDAAAATVDAAPPDSGTPALSLGATIAQIALANVGDGACSTNSAGGSAFETSCTGNDGSPEYWCADFVQWVWAQAGVDTDGLDAAAGSFYLYGQSNGTLHSTPLLGDAAVFDYQGNGVATHVAVVVQVNADGTIETVSGDWNGDEGGTEAQFASTSLSVLNTPSYPGVQGSVPAIMGMTLSGFISPVGSGGTPAGDAGASATGCYSDTLAKEMPNNACVQSASDDAWYQCDDGDWVDRDTDPTACDGTYPLN